MNAPRWDFLLLLTIVVAAATSAWGQTLVPAAEPTNSGTQSAASTPDFSGNWSHLFFPDVDRPLSGPGPVTNRSRLPSGVSNPGRLVGDYANPILRPEAAEVVRKHGEISLAGATYPTPSNQCWPGGVPYIFWDLGMQMLQEPDKITILYAFNNEVRHIRLNQSHPAQLKPSWYGDSVGHYEGDTLVIDTVGVKIGPFAMADMYGTPYTQALHVVERYRLIDHEAAKEAQQRAAKYNFSVPVPSDFGWSPDLDYKGNGLQLAFTVEDEGAFTMPWSATVTYMRPLGEWPEFLCAESRDYFAGTKAAIPTSSKPDF
jgi:hypothetical protein